MLFSPNLTSNPLLRVVLAVSVAQSPVKRGFELQLHASNRFRRPLRQEPLKVAQASLLVAPEVGRP